VVALSRGPRAQPGVRSPDCNASKRDFLAHPTHIENWHRTHIERAGELAQRFDALSLPHDAERTRAICWWA
jgi:hypothetical protein